MIMTGPGAKMHFGFCQRESRGPNRQVRPGREEEEVEKAVSFSEHFRYNA
jgi:hypothetical protein